MSSRRKAYQSPRAPPRLMGVDSDTTGRYRAARRYVSRTGGAKKKTDIAPRGRLRGLLASSASGTRSSMPVLGSLSTPPTDTRNLRQVGASQRRTANSGANGINGALLPNMQTPPQLPRAQYKTAASIHDKTRPGGALPKLKKPLHAKPRGGGSRRAKYGQQRLNARRSPTLKPLDPPLSPTRSPISTSPSVPPSHSFRSFMELASHTRTGAAEMGAVLDMVEREQLEDALKYMVARWQERQRVMEFSSSLSSVMSLKELTVHTLRTALEVVDAESAALHLVDDSSQSFTVYTVSHLHVPNSGRDASSSSSPAKSSPSTLKSFTPLDVRHAALGAGVESFVATTGSRIVVADWSKYKMSATQAGVQSHARPSRSTSTLEELTHMFIESMLCVPVKDANQSVVGVLQVVNKASGSSFSSDDEEILAMLAAQVGAPLRKSQMFERELQLRTHRDALLEASKVEASVPLLYEAIDSTLRSALELLAVARCSLFLADEEHKFVRCAGCVTKGNDQYGQLSKDSLVPPTSGLVGHVMRTERAVRCDGPYLDTRFDRGLDELVGFTTHNACAVPVFSQANRQILGVLQVDNKIIEDIDVCKFVPFTPDDEDTLVTVADQISGILLKLSLLKAERMAKGHTNVLIESIKLLNSEVSVQGVIKALFSTIKNAINADEVSIYMTNDTGDVLTCEASDSVPVGHGCLLGVGLIGRAAKNGSVAHIPEIVLTEARDRFLHGKEHVEHAADTDVVDSHQRAVAHADAVNQLGKLPHSATIPLKMPSRQESGKAEIMKARSELVVPIMNGKSGAIGVIHCTSFGEVKTNVAPTQVNQRSRFQTNHIRQKMPGSSFFSKDDELLLVRLGEQFCNSVRRAHLYEELLTSRRCNEALVRILKVSASEVLDISSMLDEVVVALNDMLVCENVGFYLVDPLTNKIYTRMSGPDTGDPNAPDKSRRRSLGSDEDIGLLLIKEAVERSQVMNIADVYDTNFFTAQDRLLEKQLDVRTRSVLCAPIKDAQGRVIAIIKATNKKAHPKFGASDETLLAAVVDDIAAILKRKAMEVTFIEMSGASAPDNDVVDVHGMLSHFMPAKRQKQRTNTRVPADLPKCSWRKSDNELPPGCLYMLNVPSNDELFRWDFDHVTISKEVLKQRALQVFDALSIFSEFPISRDAMQNFLGIVADRYRDNPYHNFAHAFSVLHCASMILYKTVALQLLRKEEVLALLIATVCHDVDHPGYNNHFLIASSDPLALLYNDRSVLENHHATLTFKILRETGLLDALPKETYNRIRTCVLGCILCTDMAGHFDVMKELKHAGETFPIKTELDATEREFMLKAITHTGDLCNPALPQFLAAFWSRRVSEEFNHQAEMEQKMGLPVTGFMKGKGDYCVAKVSIGFIEHIAGPLWQAMADLFPELSENVEYVKGSLEFWKGLARSLSPSEEANANATAS